VTSTGAPATSGSTPAATSSSTAPAGTAPGSAARTAPAGTTARPAGAADDPALPSVPDKYDVNELRAAVGATPLASATDKARAAATDDEDDDPHPRRSSRTIAIAALGIIAVVGTAALVILGYLNSDRYVLACEAERAVPEQGRGFPPWGTRAMTGEAWRPLKIAPETRCQPQETDDPLVLERAFLAMVLDQATGLLTAREVTRIDEAEGLLKQALLLTRPPEHEATALAGQRTERHKDIERLLGDVTYWRATAKLRDAAAALGDAAKQFDAAVAQQPRHASDAGAWAAYARRLSQELRAGPTGAPASSAPSAAPPPATSAAPAGASAATGAPLGTALPVEPDRPSTTAAPEAAPPDAGAPTGGVLL